jgi:hypothetical protein|tara:strand:- start:2545 stop:3132 length:588 start_codon:yes stop_codon:yes gene_type:complete
MKLNRSRGSGMQLMTGDPKKVKALDQNDKVIYVDDPELGTPTDSLDVDMLKRGISMAESLGGLLMMNPESSATGMYGQLFGEIKDMPFMEGVTREQFANDPDMQEAVFNMRLEKGIGGPSLRRNAVELTKEYQDQLGDKWDYSLNDVAALSNYLGRQGARNYFASIRDNTSYTPPGNNLPPEEYLDKFRRGMRPQ